MQIVSHSPLTGLHLGTYTTFTQSQINLAIDRASAMQDKLLALSTPEMTSLFRNLQTVLSTHRKQLIDIIHNEVGKPLIDAEFMEIEDIISGIEKYIQRLPEFKRSQVMIPDKTVYPDSIFGLKGCPVGVVGVIMPWNFPFWLPMTAIVPAVMTGNPVVFKPSSNAIGTGLFIEKLFQEAQFPEHSVQTIIGGPLAGYSLVKSEKIGRIMFVGSTEVGLDIAKRRILNKHNHLTLEMGGNSAAILFDDANFDNAVHAIFWNSVYNAGQVCTRTKRIFIHKKIYTDAKKALVALAKKYNNPELLTEKIGAIIKKSTLNVLELRVKKAIEAGNVLLEGGRSLSPEVLPDLYKQGNFFPITIIEVKNRDIDILNLETFAPVIPLIPFETEDEAILLANNTKYGLSANIFTEDQKRINRLIEKIDAGMIFINDSEAAYPGGNFWKGLGASYFSTGSDDKLQCMYERKVLWRKDSSIKREYWFD